MTRRDGGMATSRGIQWLCYLALVAIVISCASKETESWTLPRTADGQPDLQGIWNYGTETPLQRPDELAGKESLTAEEAAKYAEQLAAAQRRERQNAKPRRYSGEVFDDVLAKADWTKRTSLITDPRDGKMPPITPEAEQRRAARVAAFASPAGPEDLGLADRCILGWHSGPPIIPSTQSNLVQLFQSRDHVVIYSELNHDARIVPVNGRTPVGSAIHEYTGISRGRWEKDTLVVETTNFTRHGVANLEFLRKSGGTDENMQLIERFTRTDAKTLLYEFTITDPTIWTRPWSAAVTMLKTDERIYEYACHEANYSMDTFLAAARAKEKAAAAAVAQPAGAAKRPPK